MRECFLFLVPSVLLMHWTTQRGLMSFIEALLQSVTKLFRKGTLKMNLLSQEAVNELFVLCFHLYIFIHICVAHYANVFGYVYLSESKEEAARKNDGRHDTHSFSRSCLTVR